MSLEVNIRQQFFRVNEFFKSMDGEEPLFERLSLSNLRLKDPALFIDSIMRGIPTQTLYFDGGQRQWLCIDGNKRLNAIKGFINNEFPLEGDIHDQKVEGLYYKDIKSYLIYRFEAFQFMGHVINPSDVESRVQIKYRLQMK